LFDDNNVMHLLHDLFIGLCQWQTWQWKSTPAICFSHAALEAMSLSNYSRRGDITSLDILFMVFVASYDQ
jgi:hypothetical protein